MRLALAQLNPTIGDFSGNIAKIRQAAARAREKGADLLALPELAVTGYPPRDLLCRRDFLERVDKVLADVIAPLSREIAILIGGPVRDRGALFNAALLFAGGKLYYRQDKSLLPNHDVFEESRYFQPAAKREPVSFRGLRLGLTICEDIWNDGDYWNRKLYDSDPVEELVAGGAELLINISASPYHYGKIGLRLDMLRSLARKYRRPVLYVNQVGGNDELIFDGTSLAVDAGGNVAGMAASFQEDMLLLEANRLQAGGPISLLVVGDTPSGPEPAAAKNTAGAGGAGDVQGERAPAGILPREDISYVYRALLLGIADYLHKTGFHKALVGLSGGIDSAVVAALAAAALGPENVLGVSMPSRYTSPGSRADARLLAENLGIAFREIPIESMFSAFLAAMNEGGPPRGDLAEENIQARIRGNILMFIANREGYLVLNTGNKSELAVGYCTLYGDMSGGLGVLADVPKVKV
ncbi:MAG: NAD+ synthase, partial [Moorella sp. (in: Bacteria)]|nr:NAD+ synthase [Moorella sp. (in: firmicutes)]